MQEIKEELDESEKAVSALAQSTHARWLKMDLLHEDGVMREMVFFQDTCGLAPMQDIFNKFRAVLKSFVDGEYGIKLGELFRGQLTMPNLNEMSEEEVDRYIEDNKGIVLSLLKLIEIVPELEYDIIAISLGVERRRINWFKDAIKEPPHRGGLRVGEGFDILRHFVLQNAREIRLFFTEEATSLVETFSLAMDQAEDKSLSTGGKPSSTSSQDIPEND